MGYGRESGPGGPLFFVWHKAVPAILPKPRPVADESCRKAARALRVHLPCKRCFSEVHAHGKTHCNYGLTAQSYKCSIVVYYTCRRGIR